MMVQKLTSWVVIGSIVLLGSPMPASATYEGYSATLTDVIEDFENYDPDEEEGNATSLADETMDYNATLSNTITNQTNTTTVTLATLPAPAPAPTPMPTPIPPPPPPPIPMPMPTPPTGPPNGEYSLFNNYTLVFNAGAYVVTRWITEYWLWDDTLTTPAYVLQSKGGMQERKLEIWNGQETDPTYWHETDTWTGSYNTTVTNGVVVAEWVDEFRQDYFLKAKFSAVGGTSTVHEVWNWSPWQWLIDAIPTGDFNGLDQGKEGFREETFVSTSGDQVTSEWWYYHADGSSGDQYTLWDYFEIDLFSHYEWSDYVIRDYDGQTGHLSNEWGDMRLTETDLVLGFLTYSDHEQWNKRYDGFGLNSVEGGFWQRIEQEYTADGLTLIREDLFHKYYLGGGAANNSFFTRRAKWKNDGRLESLHYLGDMTLDVSGGIMVIGTNDFHLLFLYNATQQIKFGGPTAPFNVVTTYTPPLANPLKDAIIDAYGDGTREEGRRFGTYKTYVEVHNLLMPYQIGP